jgi:hypothetical protein
MAYRESSYKGNPAWVGVVVLLLMLGWCVARPTLLRARATPEKIAAELMSDPVGGPVFKAIHEGFPRDMERLTTDLSNRTNNGEDEQATATIAKDFIANLYREHRTDFAHAPHQNLAEIEQAQAALIDYLHGTSPQLCAKFDASGVHLEELPAGEAQVRLAAFLAAEWRAMGAGSVAPVTRDTSTLSQPDKAALAAAMRRDGLSSPELTALEHASPTGSFSPEIGCGIATHTIRAIRALPADQGDRIMAWSLQRQVG